MAKYDQYVGSDSGTSCHHDPFRNITHICCCIIIFLLLIIIAILLCKC